MNNLPSPLITDAPKTVINVALPQGKTPLITKAFTYGLLTIHAEDNTKYTSWILSHKPTGVLLHRFSHGEYKKPLQFAKAVALIASKWEWLGTDVRYIQHGTLKKWAELRKELELDLHE
jgi:hypothetical protein